MRIGLTKKLLTLTLMILMMCISLSVYAQGLEDSLVTDPFNDEYLSTKWTIINEGNPGEIVELYHPNLSYNITFRTGNPLENPVYNYSKVGLSRELPQILEDLISKTEACVRIWLRSVPSITSGYFAFKIFFQI